MGRFRTGIAFATVSIAAVLISAGVLWAYLSAAPSANALRLGFFPNVTHAQALFGIATGTFQAAFGDRFAIVPRPFNAGNFAIAALLSNQVDVIFVGPSPTLSGLSVSGPDYLRVIAGAASGGALFVIQPDVDLTTNESFAGKRFATPQAGNTQDVALKHYLLSRGHRTRDQGGDVEVINAVNAQILSLFQLRQIDGAWVPEPWATRLLREAGGKLLHDERDLWEPSRQFVTTHIVTTKRFLDGHRDILKTFLFAYVNITLRLEAPTEEDLGIVNDEVWNLTQSRLSKETIEASFMNFNVTYDPIAASLSTYLRWSQELGFLPTDVNPHSLYDLGVLNEVLEARGLPPVEGL